MKADWIDLAHVAGECGRWDEQWAWYSLLSPLVVGRTVLDVGTGISRIKDMLVQYNCTVTTQDPCEECPVDTHEEINTITSKQYDTVTCLDVLEHIKDYGRMIYDMARISREYIFITTPGVEITKNLSVYHWHEFCQEELCQLLEAAGMEFMKGWGAKWEQYPEKPGPMYGFVNRREYFETEGLHPLAVAYRHITAKPQELG